MDHLLNAKEVASRLGVTEIAVYKWCSRKLLPYYRLGRLIRMKDEDIRAFVEARRIEGKEVRRG
jgi:excisionase family DNA binding protein